LPIYEFICDECGNPFETLVMGFKTDGVLCPKCNSSQVKKKVSSFAIKGNSIGSTSVNLNSTSCNTGST
jgi:putative FmdB family regulatory protein